MTIQDDYVEHRNNINAAHAAYFSTLKTAYQEMKDCGASEAKLNLCRHAFKVLCHLANHVCTLYNECAATVPNVQPVSGGGPKDDDDDPENP